MTASVSPRIVLHIGAPKTASTYLQRRLRANADTLRRHGIYVPVIPAVAAMAGNAKLLATTLSRRPSLTFQRGFPEIDVSKLDPAKIVTDLLEDWRPEAESVVLSAENLRPNHAERLRKLLPTSVPCVVVLFVRRQDRWIDSYFNQMVKTNEVAQEIGSFVAKLCDTEGERLCRPDWFAYYESWRNALGNCRVIFYDEVASDVFGAFFNGAGFSDVPDLIDVDRAQISLNTCEVAYLLEQKQPIEFSDFLQRKNASQKASRRLGFEKTQSFLSDADLARLHKRFDESNQHLIVELARERNPPPLQIDTNTQSDAYCNLRQLYASESYVQYRKLADAIYSRRKRRSWFSFGRSV
ncbi:MAG TPA: hypothetical protein VLK27_03280 [Chthoniobacterales bacterium]|nr:hypothetical protein [Chthoniobacterales bacterium]